MSTTVPTKQTKLAEEVLCLLNLIKVFTGGPQLGTELT